MTYRLIAYDMDGTLLGSRKTLPPENAAAVRRLVEAGKYVSLATGRCIPELRDFFPQLPALRYCMCVSGALVLDLRENHVIYSADIPAETVREIFCRAQGEDVMPHILSWESYIEQEKFDRIEDFDMLRYQPLYGRVATKVDSLPEWYEEHRPPVFKLNLYCRDTVQRDRLRAKMRGLPVQMTDSERTSLEFTPEGVTKGRGLEELCRHLGITPAECAAVGDSDNDLDLLRAAGLPIAMGNGNDAVKAIAKRVVADNDHGGCAEAAEIVIKS